MRLIDADKLRFTNEWLSDESGTAAQFMMVSKADVDAAPTVDAVPVRHGHWIFVRDRYLCSICGEDAPIDSFVRDARHKERQYMAPYCYECGAKMDEVSNDPV